MPNFAHLRPVLLGLLAVECLSLTAQAPKPANQDLFPGVSATEGHADLPGFSATATGTVLAGVAGSPIGPVPLGAPLTVIGLPHLEPAQMSDADSQFVATRHAELVDRASRFNFDLGNAAWHYQQIVCAAFPDFVFLAFAHGPDVEGSSRFVAILPRDGARIRIVPTYAHGLLPFEDSWNRPGSLEAFNSILRQERAHAPLSYSPDWLLIGMCYAELSGYPVEVLSTLPTAEPTLDLLRLEANRPQLLVDSGQSANVTFSDVSRPTVTTNWTLHFNPQGNLTSATRTLARQPATIALKP